MPAEGSESGGDAPGRDAWDVTADQHYRARRGRRDGALHAETEIAASLRHDFDPTSPFTGPRGTLGPV